MFKKGNRFFLKVTLLQKGAGVVNPPGSGIRFPHRDGDGDGDIIAGASQPPQGSEVWKKV